MITSFSRAKLKPLPVDDIGNIASYGYISNIPNANIPTNSSEALLRKNNYSGAVVTISMRVKFDFNGVQVASHYYRDLATVAGFLNNRSDITATLEGYSIISPPLVAAEVTRLRLQNVRNYFVDNFGISPSRFYEGKFVKSATSIDKNSQSHCSVIITLQYS